MILAIAALFGARAARTEDVPAGRIDEVETRDGRIYRGKVLRYDVEARGYVIEARGESGTETVTVPESEVLTVRAVEIAPEPSSEGATSEPPPVPPARSRRVPLPPVSELVNRERSFLSQLLAELETSLVPKDDDARKRFDDGVKKARSRQLDAALVAFERSARLEPDCVTTALFRAALQIARGDHESAYHVLDATRRRVKTHPLLFRMLSRVAYELGYVELERRFAEKHIELEHTGADRLWRLFRYRARRDPARAGEALKRYLEMDPDLALVDAPDGKAFRRGKDALHGGEFAKALEEFSEVARLDPWLADVVRPSRAEALSGLIRSRIADGTTDRATIVSDAAVLEIEAPGDGETPSTTGTLVREARGALVSDRLEQFRDPRRLDAVRAELSFWVDPDEPLLRESIRERLEQIARAAASRKQRELMFSAFAALGAEPNGGTLAPRTLDEIRRFVRAELARGNERLVSQWIERMKRTHQGVAAAWSEELNSHRKPTGRGSSDVVAISLEPNAFNSAGAPPVLDTGTVAGAEAGSSQELELYFPLFVGSWWRYRHGDGTIDTVTLEEIENHPIRGVIRRFESTVEFESTKFSHVKSCYASSGKLYWGHGSDASLSEPLLSSPIAVGAKWDWRKGTSGEIACEREYIATDATVTCRAGTFSNCLVVRATSMYTSARSRSEPVVRTYYYARGVGLVKIDSENPLDAVELESYEITERRSPIEK